MNKIKENKDLVKLGKEASKLSLLKVYNPKLKNKKLTESEFINLCKKVEIYINTEEYKSNISIGAFSTRFIKLYKQYLNEN